MSLTQTLPEWDLSSIFPGPESPEFKTAWANLGSLLQAIETLLDQHQVRQRPQHPGDEKAFAEVMQALDAFYEQVVPLRTYLSCHLSTDTTNAPFQARMSELQMLTLRFSRLRPRLTAWMGGLSLDGGPYRIWLDEARVESQHLMSEPEEILAAELNLSGASAWAKLHNNVTSLITAKVGGKELPIAQVRNLAYSPDPSVRQEAYQAEIAAWKANEVVVAAALNGYKGAVSTLNRKRHWPDDLEPALHANRITRKALEAMQAACVASFPAWRRYFAAKAKLLGKARLDWWDLSAPVGQSKLRWDWETSRALIIEQFATFSPAKAELARRAFDERWIDAPSRKGKVGGAYCAGVGGGKSRILLNHEENFDKVTTLAHELGHAYHNLCRNRVPATVRPSPSTLAETASIMAESILVQAALKQFPQAEQLVILETDLQGAAVVVVDIQARFLFERAVFAKRRERELSPQEFCDLMQGAQSQTYGDGLASYHPYQWAVKGHYYGSNFYNFPYTFGMLFSLAIYQRYQQDPEGFVGQYDDLLASAGMHPAKDLAASFGFDLESPEFWAGGVGVLEERIERFVELSK
jgi:pepF/M3 family oligoendopeptidase